MSDGIGGAARAGDGVFEALKDGRIQGKKERLRAATTMLESSFYNEMFKAMRDTVPEGGVLSGGSGEEMFSSMLDQHVADAAASRVERGLAEALYRQLAGPAGVEEATGEPPREAQGMEAVDSSAKESAP